MPAAKTTAAADRASVMNPLAMRAAACLPPPFKWRTSAGTTRNANRAPVSSSKVRFGRVFVVWWRLPNCVGPRTAATATTRANPVARLTSVHTAPVRESAAILSTGSSPGSAVPGLAAGTGS